MNFEAFDSFGKSYLSFLDNENISAVVAVLLALYASVYAPRLPYSIVSILENPIVRGILIFMVVYMTRKSPSIALIVSVSLMVTVSLLSKYGEHMSDISNYDCSCGCGKTCKCGANCECGAGCPCKKMMHQYTQEQVMMEEQEKETGIVDRIGNLASSAQNAVMSMVGEEGILSDIKNAVTSVLPTTSDPVMNGGEFDEESLSALREKVAERQQNVDVSGYDTNDMSYATL